MSNELIQVSMIIFLQKHTKMEIIFSNRFKHSFYRQTFGSLLFVNSISKIGLSKCPTITK